MREALVMDGVASQFGEDVRAGLSREGQKQLDCKYLYDDVGSALFEAITVLPEYGLTRADERLLAKYAASLVRLAGGGSMIAELGSGSGRKTRLVLEAWARQRPVDYYPIEISSAALDVCARELSAVDGVMVRPVQAEYIDGLRRVSESRRVGERLLVLFLGSSIGNFDSNGAGGVLRSIREVLRPGDGLLLGTDLLKPVRALLAAYDDPAGVTAAFNLNLLARVNRELNADFDLSQFEHVAHFSQESNSVEMHLRSKCAQTVTFAAADFSVQFREGETIWTETSHKFSLREVHQLALASGFVCRTQWVDEEWPFAENLLTAA